MFLSWPKSVLHIKKKETYMFPFHIGCLFSVQLAVLFNEMCKIFSVKSQTALTGVNHNHNVCNATRNQTKLANQTKKYEKVLC